MERDGGVVGGRDGQGLATEERLEVAMSAPCDEIYGPEDHDGNCVHAVAGRSVVVIGGRAWGEGGEGGGGKEEEEEGCPEESETECRATSHLRGRREVEAVGGAEGCGCEEAVVG